MKIVIDRFHCNGFFDKALRFAEAGDFKRVVFMAAWYGYFVPGSSPLCFIEEGSCELSSEPSWYYRHLDSVLAELRERLLALRQRGVEIAFVSATPSGNWDIPPELLKRQFLQIDTAEIEYFERKDFEPPSRPLKSRLIALASSIGAKFIEPLDFLCDQIRCPTIDDDGVPYFRDQGHLRSGAVQGARFRFYDEALGLASADAAKPAPLAKNP